MKFLILFLLPVINCAKIPETTRDSLEFHRCLASYINSNNISNAFINEDFDTGDECNFMHKNVDGLLVQVYNEVKQNLQSVLDNQTEVECLMDTFRLYKYLEINIVLYQALLTSPVPREKSVEEVAVESKLIFTIATMECIMTKEMLMEIINDFSAKVKVDGKELNCIQKHLEELNLLDNEETSTNFADNFIDQVTEETSTELSTELEDETTNENLSDPLLELKNRIVKRSSKEFSPDTLTEKESCSLLLHNLRFQITNFNFPSLNDEQNRCMSTQLNEKVIDLLYKFIAIRGSENASEQSELMSETFKNVIIEYTYAIVECTDMFALFTNIGYLQENLSLVKA